MIAISSLLAGIKPVDRLTVSEWADQYRYLSSIVSAEPGRWRTARVPYMREIMDQLSSISPTKKVVFMKGAQIAASESGFNWIGYVIHVAPGPMLAVMPTETTMKRNSKIRLDPMIEATPVLGERIKPARTRDSGNTTLQKSFPGGVLAMAGANSASGLRSMPVRYLFLDEVDAYPLDLDGEGSPISLAIARTRTFSKKKIFITSTPTVHGKSVIEQEFELTDQRKYHVPCPHCDHKQVLEFENLVKDTDEKVKYRCIECKELIAERHKTKMLENGEWIATAPENAEDDTAGYHLSALYSPFGWLSWEEIMKEYDEAEKKNDDTKRKAFVNLSLGETYKEKSEAPKWQSIYDRRETYELNKPFPDVCFITSGVDVQKDRLEVEIVGWCEGKITQSIDYRVIMGNPEEVKTWEKLAEILDETWISEDGRHMKMLMMGVDTGYLSTYVYDFIRKYGHGRAIPLKGNDKTSMIATSPKTVDINKNGKRSGKMRVWNVGTDVAKKELYGWLNLTKTDDETPEGYCHFPMYDEHFFKGLTAEVQQYTTVKGYRKYVWVKKYMRNEPLDCRVYARAAAFIIGMDRFTSAHWQAYRGGLQKKKSKKTSTKSNYLS